MIFIRKLCKYLPRYLDYKVVRKESDLIVVRKIFKIPKKVLKFKLKFLAQIQVILYRLGIILIAKLVILSNK